MMSIKAAKDYPIDMLAHRWEGDLCMPGIQLVNQLAVDGVERVRVCERLIQSYHLAINDERGSSFAREGEDLWSNILRHQFPSDILEAVDKGNARVLSQELMKFGSSPVWFGGLTTGLDGLNWKNSTPDWVALTYFDKLLSIAEYLGLLQAPVHEAGNGAVNFGADINELVRSIERELGFGILPPDGVIPVVGLRADRGVLNYRHLLGLYGALKISDFVETESSIVEFGGGLGITALYARQMGFLDYTLLDLPISCLLAGHFLINSLGANNVSLYGEALCEPTIKILPYWECQNLPGKRYGLSLNQDGFPEMADNFVYEYLHQIKRITDGAFLSINHEGMFPRTVHQFVKSSGGFKKIYRSKSFVREGFIEEAYGIL